MTFDEIRGYEPINRTDDNKVKSLVESIKKNGWNGCPILVSEHMESLVTGSHRFEALDTIARNEAIAWDFEEEHDCDLEEIEVAENVDDILEEYFTNNDLSWEDFDTLPFDNLHLIFEGTWVEGYKNELEEW